MNPFLEIPVIIETKQITEKGFFKFPSTQTTEEKGVGLILPGEISLIETRPKGGCTITLRNGKTFISSWSIAQTNQARNIYDQVLKADPKRTDVIALKEDKEPEQKAEPAKEELKAV